MNGSQIGRNHLHGGDFEGQGGDKTIGDRWETTQMGKYAQPLINH